MKRSVETIQSDPDQVDSGDSKKRRDGKGRNWNPSSWKNFKILQQPEYRDLSLLEKSLRKVHTLPPLVHHKEVNALKEKIGKAIRGECFLLQGGDCAERFLDCSKEPIESKFKILLQMSLVIIAIARIPVIRLARMAGQFAKPRSATLEKVNGSDEMIYTFKGDNINGFDPSEREPDPNRLVQAYFHSAATLNYLRAMNAGGVANLKEPHQWNLRIKNEVVRKEYENVIDKILDSFAFLRVIGADQAETFNSVELFTSHEGLLLNYEEALTEKPTEEDGYFNLGAHFLWIGDRTRQIDGAHIEYFRGIQNPIGVKIGPTTKTQELVQLVQVLNPEKECGRLTLITRYGCDKVKDLLPSHIEAVKETGIPVLWICDPCHGNTEVHNGVKTRRFSKLHSELIQSFEIHREHGSRLGGVHLELTGDEVTECVGGSNELELEDLQRNYTTFCDPRLNYTQSLDIAFSIAHKLKEVNQ